MTKSHQLIPTVHSMRVFGVSALSLAICLVVVVRWIYMVNPWLSVILSAAACLLWTTFLRVTHWFPNIPVLDDDNFLLGKINMIITSPDGYQHEELLRVSQDYPISQFRYFFRTIVVVSDSKLAYECLKWIQGKAVIQGGFPKSIISMDTNAEWKRRRQSYRPSFSSNHLKKYKLAIKKIGLRLCEALDSIKNLSIPVLLDVLFSKLTIDVICEIAFDLDLRALDNSGLSQDMYEAMRDFLETARMITIPGISYLKYLPLSIFKKFKESREKCQAFSSIILNHIMDLEGRGLVAEDSIQRLIVDLSRRPDVTRLEVLGEITVLLIAGHETTAHTLSWFFYALAKYPNIQYRVHRAIDVDPSYDETQGAMGPAAAASEDQERGAMSVMPDYVEAVLKESMRRFTMVSSGIIKTVHTEEGITIGGPEGYHLPYKTWVMIPLYGLHNCTRNWGEDALEFRPSRWLDESESEARPADQELKEGEISGSCDLCADLKEEEENPTSGGEGGGGVEESSHLKNHLASPFIYGGGGPTKDQISFAPFSHGPRYCLGMNLALLELRTVIPMLVKRFHFTFPATEDPLEFSESKIMETFLTLRPRNKLPMIITARSQHS